MDFDSWTFLNFKKCWISGSSKIQDLFLCVYLQLKPILHNEANSPHGSISNFDNYSVNLWSIMRIYNFLLPHCSINTSMTTSPNNDFSYQRSVEGRLARQKGGVEADPQFWTFTDADVMSMLTFFKQLFTNHLMYFYLFQPMKVLRI